MWIKKRKAERCVRGTGMGRTLKWNRKALYNYTQCRAGKGLGMWRFTLDPWEEDQMDAMNSRLADMWR